MKKKEEPVAARLPEQLIAELRRIEEIEQTDRSTVVRKLLHRAIVEWKKEYMAKLYSEGRVTLERAAMEAGISVREMAEYFRQRKVPAQYDLEDLEEDMKKFYKRLAKIG
ncbi:MAG: UPF0175 family protein [Thermoproteota archaeon]